MWLLVAAVVGPFRKPTVVDPLQGLPRVGFAVRREAHALEAVDLVDDVVIGNGRVQQQDPRDAVGTGDRIRAADEPTEGRPEQDERPPLTQGGEQTVHVANDVLGRLRPGHRFAAPGVAALIGADPVLRPVDGLDALGNLNAAFAQIRGPAREVDDGGKKGAAAPGIDVVSVHIDEAFDGRALTDREGNPRKILSTRRWRARARDCRV